MAILGEEWKNHSNKNAKKESTRKTNNENQRISETELLSDCGNQLSFCRDSVGWCLLVRPISADEGVHGFSLSLG